MLYREFEPTGAARSFIKCFWLLDDPSPSPEPQRVFPDGRSELIFNLAEPFENLSGIGWEKQPQSFVVGQITGPMKIRACGPAKILGVRFHPHGANRLLNIPSNELTDSVVAVRDLNSQLYSLTDDLHEGRWPEEQVRRTNEAIVSLASKNSRSHDQAIGFAVREFERTRGLASIADVARETGISTRQLQRRFLAAVGITPKVFCRIQRFQHVIREMENPNHQWTDTAISAGYYDQAHLIRDFRQFAGTPPSALETSELKLGKLFS